MANRLATVAEIRSLSPVLSSDYPGSPYTPAMLETWSRVAARFIGLRPWGEEYSDGHALLTAHLAARAVAGAFGPAGPLTGENTAGGDSRSYASGTIDSTLDTTAYGAAYRELRRMVIARSGSLIVASTAVYNGE